MALPAAITLATLTLGDSVFSAGDVNGDGVADVLDGAFSDAGQPMLTFSSGITTLQLDVNGDVTGESGDWSL